MRYSIQKSRMGVPLVRVLLALLSLILGYLLLHDHLAVLLVLLRAGGSGGDGPLSGRTGKRLGGAADRPRSSSSRWSGWSFPPPPSSWRRGRCWASSRGCWPVKGDTLSAICSSLPSSDGWGNGGISCRRGGWGGCGGGWTAPTRDGWCCWPPCCRWCRTG